jgi:hypothetical protein
MLNPVRFLGFFVCLFVCFLEPMILVPQPGGLTVLPSTGPFALSGFPACHGADNPFYFCEVRRVSSLHFKFC